MGVVGRPRFQLTGTRVHKAVPISRLSAFSGPSPHTKIHSMSRLGCTTSQDGGRRTRSYSSQTFGRTSATSGNTRLVFIYSSEGELMCSFLFASHRDKILEKNNKSEKQFKGRTLKKFWGVVNVIVMLTAAHSFCVK